MGNFQEQPSYTIIYLHLPTRQILHTHFLNNNSNIRIPGNLYEYTVYTRVIRCHYGNFTQSVINSDAKFSGVKLNKTPPHPPPFPCMFVPHTFHHLSLQITATIIYIPAQLFRTCWFNPTWAALCECTNSKQLLAGRQDKSVPFVLTANCYVLWPFGLLVKESCSLTIQFQVSPPHTHTHTRLPKLSSILLI